ncbi:hypothetical protein [Arcanobacterium phocae]|nr:hypothetical protein [Arcanobacterium phocae]
MKNNHPHPSVIRFDDDEENTANSGIVATEEKPSCTTVSERFMS